MKVKGATVFITGANRGIGLAFAQEALAMGAVKVYAGMRKTDGFSEPGVIPGRDRRHLDSIRQAVAQCDDVTILVNNAGIAQFVDDALDERVEEVTRSMLEVNLFGVIRVTQAFAPVLGAKEHSGIINVLPNVSWKAIPAFTPYSISKAAVWSYTNHVRMALAAQNTEVVGLHVGFVDTDLTADVHAPRAIRVLSRAKATTLKGKDKITRSSFLSPCLRHHFSRAA